MAGRATAYEGGAEVGAAAAARAEGADTVVGSAAESRSSAHGGVVTWPPVSRYRTAAPSGAPTLSRARVGTATDGPRSAPLRLRSPSARGGGPATGHASPFQGTLRIFGGCLSFTLSPMGPLLECRRLPVVVVAASAVAAATTAIVAVAVAVNSACLAPRVHRGILEAATNR